MSRHQQALFSKRQKQRPNVDALRHELGERDGTPTHVGSARYRQNTTTNYVTSTQGAYQDTGLSLVFTAPADGNVSYTSQQPYEHTSNTNPEHTNVFMVTYVNGVQDSSHSADTDNGRQTTAINFGSFAVTKDTEYTILMKVYMSSNVGSTTLTLYRTSAVDGFISALFVPS